MNSKGSLSFRSVFSLAGACKVFSGRPFPRAFRGIRGLLVKYHHFLGERVLFPKAQCSQMAVKSQTLAGEF